VGGIPFDKLKSEKYSLLGVHSVESEVVLAVAEEPFGFPGVACVLLGEGHFDSGGSSCWLCRCREVWDNGLEGLDELVHPWDYLLSLGWLGWQRLGLVQLLLLLLRWLLLFRQ
jgi:hypothetical protein